MTTVARRFPALAQLARFASIGLVANVVYLGLYFAGAIAFESQIANLGAMTLSTLLSNSANRRFTFGVTDSSRAMQHQIAGLVIFAGTVAATSAILAGVEWFSLDADLTAVILLATNLGVGGLRFQLLKRLMSGRPALSSAVAI